MSAKMSTYKRRDGTSAEHGHKFEMDLTVLTYVRCLKLFRAGKLKSFMIANNMDCVGAFDDVVCRIEYDDKGSLHTKLIFIQAKHKEKPSKIAKSDVSFTTPKMKRKTEGAVLIGNKPINEYIISYLQTRKIFKEEEDCETFTVDEKYRIDQFKEQFKIYMNQERQGFRTPLMMAADNGHTNIVKILLHHGASLHKQDVLGMNALMSASCGSHIETVKYLIEQGAHINEQGIEKKTVLSDACINIDKYVDGVGYIRYLVEQAGADYGADIKAVNSDGKSVAMIAAENSQVETVKYLFELGVDILNEADANGDTCFTLCSGAENTTVLKYFIEEHKPNLDYRNNEEPVEEEVEEFINLIKLLVQIGADINLKNKDGVTPAMIAQNHENPKVS
ncbi:hypothetical protein B566_EDAN016987 [Ephemera danica]|nr:hypothetical protein B566_EDAN016987 [Ephemera danica]